jgi:hypothetical protein
VIADEKPALNMLELTSGITSPPHPSLLRRRRRPAEFLECFEFGEHVQLRVVVFFFILGFVVVVVIRGGSPHVSSPRSDGAESAADGPVARDRRLRGLER